MTVNINYIAFNSLDAKYSSRRNYNLKKEQKSLFNYQEKAIMIKY